VDYGLTAGIHSLDSDEVATWLDRVEAGNLYVNRGITGAIVRRQPFGGWKKSAVGAGTKAGGLNYLLGLGSWSPAPASAGGATSAPVRSFLREAGVTSESLERAAASDEQAWSSGFGGAVDVSALSAERNIARYLPYPGVHVRLASAEEPAVADLVRVVAAAVRAGTTIDVSSVAALPSVVASAVRALPNVRSVAEGQSDEAFAKRIERGESTRVRLVGGDTAALTTAIGGRPDVAVYGEPVTEAGRIELLPFLREQAVSITAHRFGTPNHLTDALI
jgi:RHH-type proline utilization regulon transcriptional repressor/proline dehydrogenase/delta 1-pyrroline-5-carboxylate dehydrogenase